LYLAILLRGVLWTEKLERFADCRNWRITLSLEEETLVFSFGSNVSRLTAKVGRVAKTLIQS
jgi:hypothetical protein